MLGPRLKSVLSDYGMLVMLILLCAYYSVATIAWQHPNGASGGRELAQQIAKQCAPGSAVLIVARDNRDDVEFADSLEAGLTAAGFRVLGTVKGQPSDARATLARIARSGERLQLIACNQATGAWPLFEDVGRKWPVLADAQIVVPRSYRWPSFLMPDNLLNVTSQIVILAILAIGMTMVILTRGIDLSVGSLIALAAVVSTMLIRDRAGAEAASPAGMVLCCLAAVALCGLIGLGSGLTVTFFQIPPFVVTLSMMFVASGLAYSLSNSQSINQVPPAFGWLGGEADLAGIPNAVVLMIVLYAVAHVIMTRTPLGRYIYAVGGNPQAARLSGVRVGLVLVFVYTVCGALAGLGGVIMASRLKSGDPTFGVMYELYTIAAVVVGGTSLSGGEGKVLGTLIGAFIIGVIRNGMNLTGVSFDNQMIVLGLVLLGAVLLDATKRKNWRVLLSALFRR